MRSVVLAVIGLVLTLGMADATNPDPDLCSAAPADQIGGIILYPDPLQIPEGTARLVVNVRNGMDQPIPDAFVELIIGVPGNHCLCDLPQDTGTTDADGNVVLFPSGGGCTDNVPNAVIIRANAFSIRSYPNLKSPDYSGGPPNCDVGLPDFTVFGNAYTTSAPGCTDYDNNGSTTLADFSVFGSAWDHFCP
ncbi:hypothetical protein ACFL6M_03140 [Candidatus Eisenbacteria bacterium]|uniref:Uncharacterized protein n=1 Tax=Eiseniibacteriota bacterium TaxID=2212470 RepID=A0ABV6YK69_UNCEI